MTPPAALRTGVLHVPRMDVTEVMRQASREERAIYVLPFRGLANHEAFVAAVTARWPLDPPWYGNSWDAFSDCVWEGLYQHPARRFAILWLGARAMWLHDFDVYDLATKCLAQVAEQLADERLTVGNPKDLCVVVEDCDRDGDKERASASQLFAQFLELDCSPALSTQLLSEVASCAAGELPIVRHFDFNVFSLTLDTRVGAAQLVSVVDNTDALLTFDELAESLARSAD